MAEHLTNLSFDELACGLKVAEKARTHLDECGECEARFKAIVQERALSAKAPGFEAVFQRVKQLQTKPTWLSRFRWAFISGPALALAASLFFVTLGSPPPTSSRTHLKGSAAVEVVRSPNGAPISTAHPGERVALKVSPLGHRFGVVMAIGQAGEVVRVWPVTSSRSELLPEGAFVTLEPGFEVTPGSVVLHGFFSDQPIDAEEVRGLLEREVRGERPPPLPGVRAMAVLSVESQK